MSVRTQSESRSEQLRRLGSMYWSPFLSLMSVAGALWGILGRFSFIPNAGNRTSQYALICASVVVFAVIRFPRLAITLTRLILGPPPSPAGVSRIFRGPRAYTTDDAGSLPGREADLDDCWALLLENSFLVLEGESGCGKSSFLNAALIPRANSRFRVATSRITDDPFGSITRALSRLGYDVQIGATDIRSLSIVTRLQQDGSQAPAAIQSPLLCIDQFEELFVNVTDEERRGLMEAMRDAIHVEQLRLLLVIRSDFTDLLSRLCRELDPLQSTYDLGSYFTLRAFSGRQAEVVVAKLTEPVHGQDPVIQQQVRDFSSVLVEQLLRAPRDKRLCRADEKTVLPVELQTVGFMLESMGSDNFSPQSFARLGGKTGLLRTFIDDATTYVFRKTGVPHDTSILVLRQLVSPARTKWTQTAAAIAGSLRTPEGQVSQVLNAFADKYLVNRLPSGDPPEVIAPRYELMHEHLVEVLLDAPDPALQRVRDAEERLLFWTERTNPRAAKPSHPRLDRMREMFVQTVPITEVIRLWRFASSEDARNTLRRSVRAFFFRTGVASGVLGAIAISGWAQWRHSDWYQIRRVLVSAPIYDPVVFSNEHGPLSAWMLTLANSRVSGTRDALQRALSAERAFAGDDCPSSLAGVASILHDAGDLIQSNALFADTKQRCAKANLGEGQELDRARNLVEISVGLRKVGRDAEARETIQEAQKALAKADDLNEDDKEDVALHLAPVLADLGDRKIAEQIANSRLASLNKRPDGYLGDDRRYCELANVFVLLGQPEHVLESAAHITKPEYRTRVLMNLAGLYDRQHNIEDARRTVGEAIMMADDGAGSFCSDAATEILLPQAHVLWNIDRSSVSRMFDSLEQGASSEECRTELAAALAQTGNIRKAKTILQKLDPSILLHTPPVMRSSTLARIARARALVHDYEGARLSCEPTAVAGGGCSNSDQLQVFSDIVTEYSKERKRAVHNGREDLPSIDCW
jgi:tetratricopeptide (TPR) repeat protein